MFLHLHCTMMFDKIEVDLKENADEEHVKPNIRKTNQKEKKKKNSTPSCVDCLLFLHDRRVLHRSKQTTSDKQNKIFIENLFLIGLSCPMNINESTRHLFSFISHFQSIRNRNEEKEKTIE